MNKELQSLFGQAVQLAARGEYRDAARAYETFLEIVQGPRSGLPATEIQRAVRAAAFNLAQVFNKLGNFQRALELVELGLSGAPTETGRAIALAAKGEALYGLGRSKESQAAFEEAAQAHPVIGRLNAADSMTRLTSTDLLPLAEEWVTSVVDAYGSRLSSELRAEAYTTLGKIAARRGDRDRAHECFDRALLQHQDYEDAKLQLRLLDSPPGGKEGSEAGFLSRLFRRG